MGPLRGDHAARLIEAQRLKGQHIDGAQVSEKQAKFMISTGHVSAVDISDLIDLVQRLVERATGIRLVPEVRRVAGDHP